MIIRTKNGELKNGNTSSLLEYLGVKKEVSGVHKVNKEIELIAPVPFCLSAETDTEKGFMWTLSTYDLDRFGERVDPHGWDFSQYQKNPVVEWAHRYDIPAIGKIEKLAIDDKGLHGFVIFNSKDYDPFGWSIGERVKSGVIRAGSVGFRVMEIEIPDRKTQEDGTALIFRKQELLEFSICNVPANPFALAKNIETEKTEVKQDFSLSNYFGGFINNI
jgi:HK97 family phage prohead protease